MNKRSLILIAHNIRSCHNIGSLFRTAEGLGVRKLYLTGYSPYPIAHTDVRLPHISEKMAAQIHKTALGAEKTLDWEHTDEIDKIIIGLKNDGYMIVGLEQNSEAHYMPTWKPPLKIALIVGREAEGLELEVISQCDQLIEIPMLGTKESFNVVQAAAMALYHMRFAP